MNELMIFENEEFGQVRSLMIEGEPWFVGKDVAIALGYSNPQRAVRVHVDEGDRGVTKMVTPSAAQDIAIINEPGLYSLIMSSKLPLAKKFKHWVVSDVLPSVRKHGLYAVDEVLENPDMLIAALTNLKEERAKAKALEQKVAIQEQKIAEMQPKATYYDVVLNCSDLVPISVIAKDYGWSANAMNQCLRDKGIQYKQGGKIWLLYQKYADKGYTSTKTHTHVGSDGKEHVKVHTYWTQKGRLFIYDLLKVDGILPMIEQEE